MRSTPASARLKPRRSWEVITPLLPRAPFSAPFDTAAAASPAFRYSFWLTSRVAEAMVRLILVPVSPSGTGKTFSASTASRCFSKSAAPATTISRSSTPSIVLAWIKVISSRYACNLYAYGERPYTRMPSTEMFTRRTFTPVMLSSL